MAEFASISSLLREKCEENAELQKHCQTIAAKYLDFAKKELHAQNAREENIMLKLDIGNLQSIYRTVTENNESQAELDSLLMEYYDEYLKFSFDIDECELEKLANYDEIKLELETRDSINMYQRLYERKVKMAKKMEERNIVKKYRQAEEEYIKTKTERLHLEERVNKLKEKSDEFKARRLEETKLILQLVQGSVALEDIFADQCPEKSQSQVKLSGNQRLSGITLPDLNMQKVGLSSRLMVNFKQFKIPSIPPLPRIRPINQRNGLNRLLQQSEVIRKSMQTSPIVLSGEFATPKLPGILKIPQDYPKPAEASQKTVSFDVDLHKDLTINIESQEITPKTIFDTLEPSYAAETIDDSDMEENLTKKESNTTKLEVTDDVLIKPANKVFKDPVAKPKVNIKRKSDSEDDSDYQDHSPPKSKCSPSEMSISVSSKSFMEMFLDLSKDTSEVLSPDFEPITNFKQPLKPTTSEMEKVKEIKEKKPMEKNVKEIIQKKDTKPKTKASTKQFDGFEEFLSQFAGDTSDNKNNDQPVVNDMSFDFFQSNDDGDENNDDDEDGGAGCNNLSFEF